MTQAANLAALGTNAGTTGTFPATSLTGVLPYASMPTGTVVQVVNVPFTNYTNTNSGTLIDIAGASATITPKFSNSKVLVFVNLVGLTKNSGTNFVATFKLVRGSTGLVSWDDFAGYTGSTALWTGQSSTNFLDSPATTSSTTYKIQWATTGGGTVQINNYNGQIGSSTSAISLMEIIG